MASAAEPILASALWTARTSSSSNCTTESAGKNYRLRTGCQAIDTALFGGLDKGAICCISAEVDSGAQELSQALLISHLLHATDASATVVDTALSFDVRCLHQGLVARMGGDIHVETKAVEALERVEIMKVFDFVGLTESVGEVRDRLEGKNDAKKLSEARILAPRGTVGDSEDEDEDEMLDTPASRVSQTQSTTTTTTAQQQGSQLTNHILLINNLPQVLIPLLKNNHVQTQALLASFMRSLAHLTKTHNLCTILLSTATENANLRDETPSIFSSCALRPALGRSFTYLLDVHLLVHRLPKGRKDAMVVYGKQQQRAEGKGVEMVSVVEVLQDRHGGRVGRWEAFSIGAEGDLRDVT